jgi:hypothetical protein
LKTLEFSKCCVLLVVVVVVLLGRMVLQMTTSQIRTTQISRLKSPNKSLAELREPEACEAQLLPHKLQ